ncbi:hypothetical protein BGZ83_011582 [Gryganskiella cystojenkinii]|nr:hypothetical protein BGZ83_011582 [Gryganskiella cystojenkinii]
MDASDLFPKDLFSRSIFQRGSVKKNPQDLNNNTLLASPHSAGRGTPIAVPPVPVTELFPDIKKEFVDHTIQVLDSGKVPASASRRPSLPSRPVSFSATVPQQTSFNDQIYSRNVQDHQPPSSSTTSSDTMYQSGRDRQSQDHMGMRKNYDQQQSYGNRSGDPRLQDNNRSQSDQWRGQRDSQSHGDNRSYNNRGPSDQYQDQHSRQSGPSHSRQDSYSNRQQQGGGVDRGRRPSIGRSQSGQGSRYRSPELSESNKRRLSISPEPPRTGSGAVDDKRAKHRATPPPLRRSRSPQDNSMDSDDASKRIVLHSSRSDIVNSPTKAMQKLDLKSSRSRSKSRKDKRKQATRDSEEGSSSSESSSSDSSSDSEDSDSHQLSGATPLKIHGVIHDLLLELQRTRTKHAKYSDKAKTCSKKIGDISKKLERLLRDRSDATMIDAPTIAQQPVLVATKPSSERTPNKPIYMPSVRPVQHAAPVSHSTVSASRPQPSRTQSRSGHVHIAQSNVVATLTNIHSDVRNKAFSRKPRSMIHHAPIASADLADVMVTSSLDNTINFWDLGSQRVMSSIPKDRINQPWAEDICWVGRNVLAVASGRKDNVAMNHELTLVDVQVTKSGDVTWGLQTLQETPHDKKGGIVCISALSDDNSGLNLATAGMDKNIIHWKFLPRNSEGEYVPVQQRLIHSKHTSTIHTLCYEPQKSLLVSGGADGRLIAYDLMRSDVVSEYRNQERGRINYITANPKDPNLFLLSHASTNNQLSVHDIRVGMDQPVLRFGFQSADNLSRHVVPSWHPEGALVSSGMQVEPKINIWDVRWVDVHRGPGQSIEVHNKRVFKAAFHPRRSLITSMSADSALAFIDYKLNNGTVVHR